MQKFQETYLIQQPQNGVLAGKGAFENIQFKASDVKGG